MANVWFTRRPHEPPVDRVAFGDPNNETTAPLPTADEIFTEEGDLFEEDLPTDVAPRPEPSPQPSPALGDPITLRTRIDRSAFCTTPLPLPQREHLPLEDEQSDAPSPHRAVRFLLLALLSLLFAIALLAYVALQLPAGS